MKPILLISIRQLALQIRRIEAPLEILESSIVEVTPTILHIMLIMKANTCNKSYFGSKMHWYLLQVLNLT